VIGSGPAAQKCAIDSAKRGKRVAMIDKNSQFGGVCVVSREIEGRWVLVLPMGERYHCHQEAENERNLFMNPISLQHTGTIPSKTFREAVLHLTGYRHQGFYGKGTFLASQHVTMDDILKQVRKVEDAEAEVGCWHSFLWPDLLDGHQ